MNDKTDNFVVDDESTADWALQKIKENKEKIREKEDIAEERVYQIEQWLAREKEKLEDGINYLEGLLGNYAAQRKEDEPDLKTISLPFGKIQYRKQRAKWKYDDDKLTDFAEQNMPDVVQTKKKVNKNDLKKKCKIINGKVINTETGEVVEGVEVEERGEKLKIKTL